ncbi:MAG: hypothetical protein OEX77_05875 [Candidatus Bathyarchaeota archaeon]|nr:hypothetical protein [Candidatus Bathyarchaeota archaeon]MDH5733988.1 hypothetical protein [Candidatus Bathyarchaeota archaeon]
MTDADEMLDIFRCVDLIGSWKALSWVSKEIENGSRVEDLADLVSNALSNLGQELGTIFKTERLLPSMKKIVQDRMKEKVELSNPQA